MLPRILSSALRAVRFIGAHYFVLHILERGPNSRGKIGPSLMQALGLSSAILRNGLPEFTARSFYDLLEILSNSDLE